MLLFWYFTTLIKKKTKFGTCTVLGVNWTLDEAKRFTFTLESTHFIFNKCPFILTTVQVPNLAPTYKKRITVYKEVQRGSGAKSYMTSGLPIYD